MKHLAALSAAFVLLTFSIAWSDELTMVIKSTDELASPDIKPYGVIEISGDAPVSALESIIPILKLTPETAEEKWGKAVEAYENSEEKVYRFDNGWILSYSKATGNLACVAYVPPKDAPLPFQADIVAQWGFAPDCTPDADTKFNIRWSGPGGGIKEITLFPAGLNTGKLDRLQILFR